MSYHLRALQKWGIVEPASASADGRQRPWRAAGRGLRVESAEPRVSAVAEAALLQRVLDRTRRDVLDWIARDRAADRWNELTTIAAGARWMTEDEAEQFVAEYEELVDKYRRADSHDRPDGARRVRVSFVLVPSDKADD